MSGTEDDFPGVPGDLLLTLRRSREDIAVGRVSDAEKVEREIQARVERMRAGAPRVGIAWDRGSRL